MPFIQHVLHLQYCFSFNYFWYLRLLLFQIKSQPVHESVVYKKAHNIVLQTWRNLKKQLSLMVLFLCLFHISLEWYSLKNVYNEELGENIKGTWPYTGCL